MQIILLTVRRYTSVLLTTFATVGRPVKSSSSSKTIRRWPLQGKDIKDYV